jgi:hypothetical protein
MKLGSIDTVITQQALIVGRVEDTLTGRATLNLPTVELYYQTLPGQPTRRYPLTPRIYRDGVFVFVGSPTTTFPLLAPGSELGLRLTVEAPGYESSSVDFSLSATELTPVEQVRQIDGRDVTLALLAAPLVQQEIALSPQPVHLSGRVVNEDNRDEPIVGAQVRVIAPEARGPVTTDENGFFTLLNMPVALVITVEVEQGGFATVEQDITLDYRRPVNEHTFALTPNP